MNSKRSSLEINGLVSGDKSRATTTQIIDEKREIHPPEHAEPLHSTAISASISAAGASAGLPIPLAEANTGRTV
jgi:hypothetical protein